MYHFRLRQLLVTIQHGSLNWEDNLTMQNNSCTTEVCTASKNRGGCSAEDDINLNGVAMAATNSHKSKRKKCKNSK
jgi:hypothetical protein